MDSKFDNIINEYVSGNQDSRSIPAVSQSPVAGGTLEMPPDTGTNTGHTKKMQKALKRDKVRKKQEREERKERKHNEEKI